MPTFDCPEPITVNVKISSGHVHVIAEDRDTADVTVEPADGRDASREQAERTTVDLRGNVLEIHGPEGIGGLLRRSGGVRVTARVPTASGVETKVSSADVELAGTFNSISLNGASGDVRVEQVTGDAYVNSASGDLRIGRVDGHLAVKSASGDVHAGVVAGETRANTASGDVHIEFAGAGLVAHSASGDIDIDAVGGGTVKIDTASGDVTIGVPAGTGVWLDLTTVSGSTRSDLEINPSGGSGGAGTPQLTLQVRTVSGDIDVRRVAAAA